MEITFNNEESLSYLNMPDPDIQQYLEQRKNQTEKEVRMFFKNYPNYPKPSYKPLTDEMIRDIMFGEINGVKEKTILCEPNYTYLEEELI